VLVDLRRLPQAFKAQRLQSRNRAFLGYAEGALAVLIATLFSQKAHHAGLPEYLTLYPLAVAAVSALWGIRHGLFAAVLSVFLTRVALVHDADALFPAGAESIRLLAISFSTLAAAALVGVVREQRDQLERSARALKERQERLTVMHRELRAAEARRDEFCRDILLAVSHGKLCLCPPEEMRPDDAVVVLDAPLQEPADVTHLRHAVSEVALSLGMAAERCQDVCVCLGEAATNAILHAGGGHARIYAGAETLWIHVLDSGPGIDEKELPRATLVKGYSTRASLGMGFSLMLELADSLRLCTGNGGTQLLLEMRVTPPQRTGLELSLLDIQLDDSWDAISLPAA
jgi:anti-sigma regulatory factor (Ser/Thr protein kinase)